MSKGIEADPEEGEIVDDEFEAISDSSMILNDTGKSLSPKDHLPVISLSSVSDVEDNEHRHNKMMRKFKKFRDKPHHKHHHHHHIHHRHKWKRRMKGKCHKMKKWKRLLNSGSTSFSSDDSSDLDLHKKLQNQLKAAIRVEVKDDNKNSLKARLRAMTKLDEPEAEKTSDNMKSDSDNKVEEQKIILEENSEDHDNELIQLRLEALRTAVLNKFEHRKKRKIKEMEDIQESSKTDNLEINKENAVNENESDNKRPCIEKPDVNITPPDEDEDVLRALLLASMSKKITKDVVVQKVESSNKKIDSISKHISVRPNLFVKKTAVPFMQHIPPRIKPIIINIDSDSESEDEKSKSSTNIEKEINSNKKINTEIESTVERFLREQRAKVEAQSVQKSKAIEPPSVPKPNAPTNQVSLKTPVNKGIISKHKESVILEKSSVKLLPKVKQIEYQKLLLKLKNAQKKSRVRRASFKGGDENSTCVKIVKNKVNGVGYNKILDIKEDAKTLHLTLKQMQKQQNGRLQIEEKYVVLTPIIRKINESTTERKKYDQEVKRLMTELADAKRKLQETHRHFSAYVKELLTIKEEIDKSPPQQPKETKKNGESKLPVTSTPIKPDRPVESLEVSTVPSTPNDIVIETQPLKLSIDNQVKPEFRETSPIKGPEKLRDTTDGIKLKIQATKEKEIIFKMDADDVTNETDDADKKVVMNGVTEKIGETEFDDEINPGDPNDILRLYEHIPQYVSPLDSVKRGSTYDPFVIMCPYDIDGNCRDPECTYKHYSR